MKKTLLIVVVLLIVAGGSSLLTLFIILKNSEEKEFPPIDELESKILTIDFFDSTVIHTMPWGKVIKERIGIDSVVFKLEELDSLNWKIQITDDMVGKH